ncbi:MAG: ribosome silencing factor [Candidatus Cloacimonetes bacterium]|nr:ribosome silencing factor [Candidatus Cloacimonadota bacterium]
MEQQQEIANIKNWIEEKKGIDIKHIDVTGKTDFTDHLIICSGTAPLHNSAIADNIVQNAKANNIEILSTEGKETGSWILIDLGDIIVHIFNVEKRNYYKIEELYAVNSRPKKEKVNKK